MATLEIQALELQIGEKLVCRNLNLCIQENERWGLLGKNGAGKTTLLHSLLGLRPITSGHILIDGKELAKLPRMELAAKIGILFQQGLSTLPATVFETVMLGRHPHVQSLLRDNPADVAIAHKALAAFDLDALSDREIDTLSGGELQRLSLAMLVAQTPQIFLLDEPSNHLDVAFQVKLLSILEQKISEQSACLLMATHDINLAARFCDRIILLKDEGEFLIGERDEILNEENLSAAYNCPIKSLSGEGRTLFYPL
ncbi:MAG: ABC transporter ATP-binding protein [Pseudohongiella sp.]|jgi:iron complex transport system ATP-binding protein|nr:ABC transporter ATP-binding protein [Pseudohongiella sp.]